MEGTQCRVFAATAIACSFLCSLVACGGGDSSSSPVVPTSTATPNGGTVGTEIPTGTCYSNAFQWHGAPGVRSDANPRFTAVNPMTTTRAGHTATLMQNGRVLLTGGGQLDINDLLVSVASAEVFDPAAGTFTQTGAPCKAREFHTATLLTNGKVLITGGREFAGYPTRLNATASAELYDSDLGRFLSTGAMTASRTRHTASLLLDGRVLIVGGGATGSPTAELYDPATGTFSVVAGSGELRLGHTATVLASGKVLITGGQPSENGNEDVLPNAEVYDLGTNSFTPVGSMSSPRSGHTATLLSNGKVLVVGGGSSATLAVGGLRNDTVLLPTAELFDPGTASFTSVASMTTGRFGHTATLQPDGKVAILGGFRIYSGPVGYQSYDSVELFDPATALFTSVGSMPLGRFWHTATLLPNGAVLLAGGIGAGWALTSVESYQ